MRSVSASSAALAQRRSSPPPVRHVGAASRPAERVHRRARLPRELRDVGADAVAAAEHDERLARRASLVVLASVDGSASGAGGAQLEELVGEVTSIGSVTFILRRSRRPRGSARPGGYRSTTVQSSVAAKSGSAAAMPVRLPRAPRSGTPAASARGGAGSRGRDRTHRGVGVDLDDGVGGGDRDVDGVVAPPAQRGSRSIGIPSRTTDAPHRGRGRSRPRVPR